MVCHVFDTVLHCAVVTSILLKHLMEIFATGNNVVFFLPVSFDYPYHGRFLYVVS